MYGMSIGSGWQEIQAELIWAQMHKDDVLEQKLCCYLPPLIVPPSLLYGKCNG